MKKAFREIAKLAQAEGVEYPKVVGGDPHARLLGYVAGIPLKLVVSGSKALANQRYQRATKLSIRREVQRLRFMSAVI